MFAFLRDLERAFGDSGFTPFMAFFLYVWLLWAAKALLAARYRPWAGTAGPKLTTTVIVPVYNEDPELFRRVLASVAANQPSETIVVVDGGDPTLAAIGGDLGDRVLTIPKSGKRAAIAAGLAASNPATDVVVVLDSDTIWEVGALAEMLRPFSDPRVGGVTPRQAIFDARTNRVRIFANWLEDLRYHLTVPAQSVFGQVGCLAGRTIAYRRSAFEPAVERLVKQTVLGLPQHVGDDRVLTNELLRNGWRTVYQSTAHVSTDAPSDWRTFWRQQLRWGRSSQRETLLSLRWLWRKPVALVCFATDVLTPFALYGVIAVAVAHVLNGTRSGSLPLPAELSLAYVGMLVSIGLRQVPHFRRQPADVKLLPLFVLQLTFLMVPARIVAFATLLHQEWATRPDESAPRGRRPPAQPEVAPTLVRVGSAVFATSAGAAAFSARGEGRGG
jgi:hyaluronan synthase